MARCQRQGRLTGTTERAAILGGLGRLAQLGQTRRVRHPRRSLVRIQYHGRDGGRTSTAAIPATATPRRAGMAAFAARGGGPARTSAPDRRAAVGRVRTGSSRVRPRAQRLAPVAALSTPTGSGPDGAAVRFPTHGPGLRAPRCPRRCVRGGSPWRGGAGSANQDDQPVGGRGQEALRSSCPRFCGRAPLRENPPSGTSSRDSRPHPPNLQIAGEVAPVSPRSLPQPSRPSGSARAGRRPTCSYSSSRATPSPVGTSRCSTAADESSA